MEVGSLIGLAAATRGEIEIEDATPPNLRMTKIAFAKLGISWETAGDAIRVPAVQSLKVVPTMGGQIPKIDDAPGRGSPRILPASPSWQPRRRKAWCSFTRRCSSRACSTWTGSSAWAPRSSSATRTGPWCQGPPGSPDQSWRPPTCARHGHADCGHVRPGKEHHPERLPDRERVREPHPAAPVARGPDHQEGRVPVKVRSRHADRGNAL